MTTTAYETAIAIRHRAIAPLVASVDEVASWLPKLSVDAWEERDREVAAARERDRRKAELVRLRERAKELRTSAFPAIAVDGALAIAGAGDGAGADGKREPVDTAAMRLARAFVAEGRGVLVLAGGTGTGKTTAASWVALQSDAAYPAFVRAAELEARGRYDRALRDWLRSRSLLVLDDVGSEVLDGKGVFRSLLDEVIDSFYSDRKPVIITTNLRDRAARPDDEPQFVERYGGRVLSRLAEVGVWGNCGMRDLRRGGQP